VQRRTILRIVAPVLGVAVAVAVAIGAYQLGKPSSPPAKLVVGSSGSGGGGAPACSETPKKGADGLKSYPTSCGEGATIIAAYTNFINAYNTVLDDPYGHDRTLRQELGHVYASEAQGTLKATQIPQGCAIPPPSAHAVSWPKACDALLTKTDAGDPLAPVATAMSGITTPTGTAHMLHVLSGNLDAGYMTSGHLVSADPPIVRQVVSRGGSIFTTAPNPTAPLAAWSAPTVKATAPTAVVWACLASHLTATNLAGVHAQYAPYWAVNVYLVQMPTGWRVSGWGVQTTLTPIAKGSPCGTAY